MGSYCTDLADGGIFVAQAIQGGVDYIIRKDNVQREFKVLMAGSSESTPSSQMTNGTVSEFVASGSVQTYGEMKESD